MAIGWIRAWAEEYDRLFAGEFATPNARAEFRRQFGAELRDAPADDAAVVRRLVWDREVELPDGLSSGPWTRVRVDGDEGFIVSAHLVEIAFVDRGRGRDPYTASLVRGNGEEIDLLWGDLVQIRRREGDTCYVRARGVNGRIDTDRLTATPLLEVYFIDVGQGDGVLVRTPEGRHLLVDGGLPRSNQMTGKNAADFVDWKFFSDYGHHAIDLDAVVASHCDYDHYGGLWDLVRHDASRDDELDVLSVRIGAFYHAGLSRWEERSDSAFPHRDKLGPNDDGWFVRLLEDRADADAAIVNGADEELQGYWKWFIGDIIERNADVAIERLGVRGEDLRGGGLALPTMWEDTSGLRVRVLAPVTRDRNGQPALKDFGDTGQNTNGHSVGLRIEYGAARILLTGDLNKKSMEWLRESYGDCMGAFNCDVFKACHHGSYDVSYAFLEQVKAGATIVSSGDAEGYGHPRPEIVAASAVTGHLEIDRDTDRLVTPLVYMTEIERSTSLGKVMHIRFRDYPAAGETLEGALFAVPLDDISEKALPTREDRRAMARAGDAEAEQIEKDAVAREKALLQPLASAQEEAATASRYHYRTIRSLFNIEYGVRNIAHSRIMTRNHYGLVNVRTDGETVMCATMRETGRGWTVHTFKARFF